MFPVFAPLLMILKSVSRCLCHIVNQPHHVCHRFVKQETQMTDFPDSFNGVRHSVYLGFNEKQISVSFFFATIFGLMMLYVATNLSEFRLMQSRIDPNDFAANSPYTLLELIRHIPTGAKRRPLGTYPMAENLFFKSVFSLVGLRIFFYVLTASCVTRLA